MLFVLFHILNIDLNRRMCTHPHMCAHTRACTCVCTHTHTPHGVKAERGLFGGRKGASMGWGGLYGGNYEQSSKVFVDKNVTPAIVYI